MSVNIAMWSGPRNISTAMMYSFANRLDCQVWDEPFYAFSLKERGNDHPLREEIMASYDTDYETVVARCLAPSSEGKSIFYQKHMTHHMLPGFDKRWILELTNAFLIRDPLLVLASYAKKWQSVTLRDIGIIEQWEIFKLVADTLGSAPVVVDAEHILTDPPAAIRSLCNALRIGYSDRMLSWPAGPKPFDGLWGRHWYNAVHASTSFARVPALDRGSLPAHLQRIADEAATFYERLRAHRLSLGSGEIY
jgi:Sulfotransferase domain